MREGILRKDDFIIFLTPLGVSVVICPRALETALTWAPAQRDRPK